MTLPEATPDIRRRGEKARGAAPAPLLCLLLALGACASPRRDLDAGDARRRIEASKERSAHFLMLTDDEMRRRFPGVRAVAAGRVPNLMRVGALMPRTMQAEMAAWGALSQEGSLDPALLREVFWVVSSENDCFY